MLESVLVANRGEIAARIVRACRDAGIRSIAVYSDADADSEHVRLADQAVHLGGSEVDASYLDIDRIIAAAKQANAAAVHPGYGLLSERGEFAERVAGAGLVFVGPAGHVIELLGDKRSAREQAEAAGLAVLPARAIAVGDDTVAAAEAVGYPLLVKAAFGGGGRGMRVVGDPGALADALEQANRENHKAFGRAEAYLERFLARPRHVEVQVLADRRGTVVHLGTRDCTMQRRHQKLVEEAPAFGLSPDVEARALAGSAELMRAVGYEGAATVEFLVDNHTGRLYFLEVNTRLQVEHTVSEAVTGIDIVAAQLAIAAGEPLPFTQEDVRISGHAIEARLNAEDPVAGFLPHTGTIDRLRLPSGPWIRVDAAVTQGSPVTYFYDSLLAKITAWGPDRDTARTRLARALAETVIDGVPTTTGFLARVLDGEPFRAGTHWTSMIDDGLVDTAGLEVPAATEPAPRHRSVRIRTPNDEIWLDVSIAVPDARPVTRSGTAAESADRSAIDHGSGGGLAPMDAVLVRNTVEVGDRVEVRSTVAIVESMKMETHVTAGARGVVTAVHAAPGDSLKRGQRLVTIEAAS